MTDKNSPYYVKSTISNKLERYTDSTKYEKKIEVEGNNKKVLDDMARDLIFWGLV